MSETVKPCPFCGADGERAAYKREAIAVGEWEGEDAEAIRAEMEAHVADGGWADPSRVREWAARLEMAAERATTGDGRPLAQVHPDYLLWLRRVAALAPDLRRLLAAFVSHDDRYTLMDEDAPPGEAARLAALLAETRDLLAKLPDTSPTAWESGLPGEGGVRLASDPIQPDEEGS